MKKKLLSVVCGLLILVSITGCGNNSKTLDNGTKLESKGKCIALDCINQISIENTVGEINNIIGFNGKLTDEKYNKYYWELSDNTGIEVSYYSGTKGTIKADIDRELLRNNQVSFSRYDELQTKIKEGISYKDFISYIGNVEGTLIEKSRVINEYVWVSSNGSYLYGSFSNSSGDCTFISGRVN